MTSASELIARTRRLTDLQTQATNAPVTPSAARPTDPMARRAHLSEIQRRHERALKSLRAGRTYISGDSST